MYSSIEGWRSARILSLTILLDADFVFHINARRWLACYPVLHVVRASFWVSLQPPAQDDCEQIRAILPLTAMLYFPLAPILASFRPYGHRRSALAVANAPRIHSLALFPSY